MLSIKPQLKRKFKKVQVVTNHFDISINPNVKAYRYDLTAYPDNDQSAVDSLTQQVSGSLSQIFGWHKVSGKTLYTLRKPRKPKSFTYGCFEIKKKKGTISYESVDSDSASTDAEEGSQMLTLTPVGESLELAQLASADHDAAKKAELLQVFNVYLAGQMNAMKYNEFGYSGRFFDSSFKGWDVMKVIRVLPGFKVTLGVYENSKPKLLVDWISRITRTGTLWEEWCQGKKKNQKDFVLKDRVLGANFLNLLTGKLVRVSGIDFKMSPKTKHPDSKFINFEDYFSRTFNACKVDKNQFLVFSYKKKSSADNKDSKTTTTEPESKEGGDKKKQRERIYYLPQFLQPTGMTDFMKNDRKMMEAVAEYTKKSPAQRNQCQTKLLTDLKNRLAKSKQKVIQLDEKSNKIEAMVMPKPKITFRKDTIVPEKGNFFVKGKIREGYNFRKWAIIWERDEDFAYEFADRLYDSCCNLGIEMDYAEMIEIRGRQTRPDDIKKACQRAKNYGAEMVVHIMDRKTSKKGYKIYKEILCKKYGLKAQGVILHRKIFHKRGVIDKIAIQMATKMGVSPWLVQKPLDLPETNHGVMMIGADVFHSRGKESIASVVGTTDADFTKHCSFNCVQPRRGQEIMNSIASMVLKCINEYRAQNGKKLPKTVVFYRDGVGSGQHQLVEEEEIRMIKEQFAKSFGSKAPSLVFILVTKRINNRFFEMKGKGALRNPENGLIVHSDVVSADKFDFFMVAQNVTQGTATPTHYEVLLNESEFSADLFYSMTYFQTYNYYNWSGPVKVPAVCQYAHKQAYLLGETYKGSTHPSLKLNLFYL